MKYLKIILDNFRLKAMTRYRICELGFSFVFLLLAIVYWSISSPLYVHFIVLVVLIIFLAFIAVFLEDIMKWSEK